MEKLPDCFYRVSVKALILNERKDKFLIAKERSGKWELLGGGLEWGTCPAAEISREIAEEAGLQVTSVSDFPSYFYVKNKTNTPYWYANVVYETTVQDLNFTASDECVELQFVNKESFGDDNVCEVTRQLLEEFDPKRHG